MENPFKAFNSVMRQNMREAVCMVKGHKWCRCRLCLLRISKGEQFSEYCRRCGFEKLTRDGKGA